MMVNLIVRLVINAIALWAAATVVNGFEIAGSAGEWLVLLLVFGLVNAIIKPIVKLLTLPINIMTLGLFTLVINALLLWLTSWLVNALTIDGFFPALWGSIIVSVVSTVLSWILED